VIVEYDLEQVLPQLQHAPPYGSTLPGLGAFSALLPVVDLPPYYATDVGHTPLVPHRALSEVYGVEVFIKNEGSNPSGSFKDRGLSVAVALGLACGARRFCLPTQGNAGVAASLFCARLGLPGCLVYMPEGYQGGVYHRSAEFFGAEVHFGGANITASGGLMRKELSEELASGEIVELSTFFEPGRLEGKKTMGLEIADQLPSDSLPDFILYPTGGGTGLVGIWKAFNELVSMGLLDRGRLPAMVAVQSSNCDPVVSAFDRGLEHVVPVESLGTVADGLDVSGAIMGHGILDVLRQSGGTAVAVQEEDIIEAFDTCGRLGLPVGYESAALVVALARLCADGFIPAASSALLLLTSTHLIAIGQDAGLSMPAFEAGFRE
jgi:threonine synthase